MDDNAHPPAPPARTSITHHIAGIWHSNWRDLLDNVDLDLFEERQRDIDPSSFEDFNPWAIAVPAPVGRVRIRERASLSHAQRTHVWFLQNLGGGVIAVEREDGLRWGYVNLASINFWTLLPST